MTMLEQGCDLLVISLIPKISKTSTPHRNSMIAKTKVGCFMRALFIQDSGERFPKSAKMTNEEANSLDSTISLMFPDLDYGPSEIIPDWAQRLWSEHFASKAGQGMREAEVLPRFGIRYF